MGALSGLESIVMKQVTGELELTRLIEQARRGDRESMGQLAELAEGRLLAYIYRLTLNYDLSQELVQQTLLKMVQRLNELQRIDRFWPWLFRNAMGEAQHYFRDCGRRQNAESLAMNREKLSQYAEQNHPDGLTYSSRLELSNVIVSTIAQLRLAYRNVLILRCYEDLSFAEIAEQMGCKEHGARVLFFRAKKALKTHLQHRGFGKQTLLTALGLFGLVTLPFKSSSTAYTVNAASLNVGLLATFVGTVCTKVGLSVMALLATLVAAVTFESVMTGVIVLITAFLGIVIGLYLEPLFSK